MFSAFSGLYSFSFNPLSGNHELNLLGNSAFLDVAFLAISRFILLDSMLLFFTTLVTFCLTAFRNYRQE